MNIFVVVPETLFLPTTMNAFARKYVLQRIVYTKFFRPGYIYDETATLRNVCMDVCETNYCPNGQVCVHTDDGAVCIDDRSKFLKKSL